mgnify:CR=1 FL=1
MEDIDDNYEDNDSEYDILDVNQLNDSNIEDISTFTKNYSTLIKEFKTSMVLTKYERTRILSERAQQIEDGSPPYISNIERFNTSYAIAMEEFKTKKIPFIIRRSIPHTNEYEYWKLKDMIF